MDLTIIVVNWNSANDVQRCLRSLFATTKDLVFETIVVDNASFDSCQDMLDREFPQVRFLQSKINLGFGKANNLGVQAARGGHLLFLNPDTEIQGSALRTMLDAARRHSQAGCVGCRLLNSDRSLQTSCIQSFPTLANQLLDSEILRRLFPNSRLWGIRALHRDSATPSAVEVISGACIMIRREVFDAVGGFSADYFMYAEDADLCYKTARAGWTNLYVPAASVIHHGDSSVRKARTNFAMIMAADALTRYFRKHHGRGYAVGYRTAITAVALARLAVLAPAQLRRLARREGSGPEGSWTKWRAILRWGWGRERWVANYR